MVQISNDNSNMQVVRQSKFRNVFCKPAKLDFCMDIASMPSEIVFCAVNPKFIAFILEKTNGYFMVVPLNKSGKIDSKFPVVEAHNQPCLKLAWYPFNDCFVASCSDDGTAKVWRVPEGGLQRTLTEPLAVLAAHTKRVVNIVWHPTAQNVLLTAGDDLKIYIWDVCIPDPLIEVDGHPDVIWSVVFNHNGSLIMTTCRDRIIRIIEPRSGLLEQDVPMSNDEKIQKSLFLNNGKILTSGLTKHNRRLFSVREEDAINSAIATEELDMDSGTVVPLFDADSGLLFICGRGDSFVRYYEIDGESPFIHYINTYRSIDPQRCAAFMPKRGLNVYKNEIARIYKCISRGSIQVLHFYVPRWTKGFQEDLFPDTNGTIPAMTSEEWMSGKNADPVKVPVQELIKEEQPIIEPRFSVSDLNVQMNSTSAKSAVATCLTEDNMLWMMEEIETLKNAVSLLTKRVRSLENVVGHSADDADQKYDAGSTTAF